MRFLFATAIVGLAVVATFSTPASAWQCMARSTNGAVGLGSGIILERAQKFAIHRWRPEEMCLDTLVVLLTVDRTQAGSPVDVPKPARIDTGGARCATRN